MKKSDIEKFEKIQAQIEGFHNEISTFSKKRPNDCVNEFKLKLINQVLLEANVILKGKYRPFEDFEKFDLDKLPSNSDVTFILSQYFNCLEKLRLDNIHETYDYNANRSEWFWRGDSLKEAIKTSAPKKMK